MIDSTYEFTAYLAPNERVLWQGQGRRKFLAFGSTSAIVVLAIIAALGFGMLATCLTASNLSRGPAYLFPLVLVAFILVIVGLSIGIPLMAAGRRTSNARYAVTTSSALIISQGPWSGKRVTMLPLKSLPQVTLVENRDGTGTLLFSNSPYVGTRYSSTWVADALPGFWNIEQPMNVYQLIRKQMAGEP